MSKGSRVRPYNKGKFDKNYARVFGSKKLNVWKDAPPKEDLDGIQRDARNGMRDWSDGGRYARVPQEPGGAPDPQTAGSVEPPPRGNRSSASGKRPRSRPTCRNCGSQDCTPNYCNVCGGGF